MCTCVPEKKGTFTRFCNELIGKASNGVKISKRNLVGQEKPFLKKKFLAGLPRILAPPPTGGPCLI